jgi:kynurenine formamidase
VGVVRRYTTRSAIGAYVVALLSLALAACAAGQARPPGLVDAAPQRSVDLSHVVHERVPYLPGEPPTRLDRDASGRLTQLTIGAHTGSLLWVVGAPGAAPMSVEGLSPRDLVLPAVVIDARDQAQERPDFALSAADVLAWEHDHGRIPPGALVLLTTGWDLRWGDAGAYLNLGPDGAPRVPGFASAAADLLLNKRGVAGLGVDAPATAHRPAAGFTLLLANLTSLEQLPPTGATVVIGALKLQAAESSPARVLALVP